VAKAVIRQGPRTQIFGRRTLQPAALTGAMLPRLGLTTASPEMVEALLQPLVAAQFDPVAAAAMPRGVLAAQISALVDTAMAEAKLWLDQQAIRRRQRAWGVVNWGAG
jgi:hypothetical protein